MDLEEIEAIRQLLGNRDVVSIHPGHHPEIQVNGDSATGIWYFEDYLIFLKANTRLRGDRQRAPTS